MDIRQEMQAAIERSGQTKNQIARELYTTPQNVTNWLEPQRTLPLARLVQLANYLGDRELMFKIFEYEFGVRIISNRRLNGNTPIAWIVASTKEEDDRHKLEEQAQQVLNNLPTDVSRKEVNLVNRFDKELSEEIESENNLHISIEDWVKLTQEAISSGTSRFK